MNPIPGATHPAPARRGRLVRLTAASMALAVLAVVVVFGGKAASEALWPKAVPGEPTATLGPAPAVAADPVRFRCETCGLIETITHQQAVGTTAGSTTFGVRLPDGSLRLSSDPLPGRWVVGDRMQLMDGAAGRSAD